MNLTLSVRGEWVSLASAFLWSISTMIYRVYGGRTSPVWLNLYKGVVALPLLVATVMMTGGFSSVSWQIYSLLALSGVIGISLGDTAFFAALPKIGGGLTSAIQCIAPPLTALGAVFFLSEHLSLWKTFGLTLTTSAIASLVIFERPPVNPAILNNRRPFYLGLALALLAACCQATGVLIARNPLAGLSPTEGSAHRLLLSTVLLLTWDWQRSGRSNAALWRNFQTVPHKIPLTIAAFIGTYLGLVFMVYGMTHAPVGIALAINSSYPIWVAVLEFAIFKHTIKKRSVFCLLVAITGLFIILQ